jgi:hypothetical protein
MVAIAIKDLTDIQAKCGRISYNGAVVPNLRTVNLVGSPIYDSSGRTNKHTLYTLNVTFHVFSDADLAEDETAHAEALGFRIELIRNALSQPGRRLVLKNTGAGDFVVNPNSVAPPVIGGNADPRYENLSDPSDDLQFVDPTWGPRPGPFRVFNFAGTGAAECSWSIQFAIFESEYSDNGEEYTTPKEGPLNKLDRLVSLNTTITYNVDGEGLCTRVVSGTVEVPIMRQGISRSEFSTADDVIDYLNPTIPEGFRRMGFPRQISEDRRTLTFQIIDKEMGVPAPPLGCVEAEATWDISNQGQVLDAGWLATLSGSVKLAPYQSAMFAAAGILQIISQFTRELYAMKEVKGVAMPVGLKLGGEMYGRTRRFAITFYMNGCLHERLFKSGIWKPASGDWQTWKMSIAPAWSPRGYSGTKTLPLTDAIVDLGFNFINDSANGVNRNLSATFQPIVTPASGGIIPTISLQNSWLKWSNKLFTVKDHKIVEHEPAEDVPQSESPTGQELGTKLGNTGSVSDRSSVIQKNGQANDIVVMIGHAVRVGAPPVVPQLKKVGGVDVDYVMEELVDGPEMMPCYFGYQVFKMRWRITYKMKKPVKTIQLLPDVSACCPSPPQFTGSANMSDGNSL